jgi:ribosomal protein S18 acetylase RimI-like enzyme
MNDNLEIIPLTAAHTAGVEQVLESSGLFPPELLGPMVAPYLEGMSQDIWLVARDGDAIVGFAYAAPERMTDGTWNLLAIAVDASEQSRGVGTALMHRAETVLTDCDQRLLLVETSGLDDYAPTRRFYRHLGYVEEARIRDFYQAGEDKISFIKALR